MTAPLKVYVAASSAEVERAAHVMNLLEARGDGDIAIVSTWPLAVAKAGGVGNPADASREQRIAWSLADLAEVDAADVVLFLVSHTPARGAYFEIGYATARGKLVFSSGGANAYTTQSIFLGLTREYEHDFDACASILRHAKAGLRG